MTEQEVQAFCANNGISVSAPGKPLHVVNPDELPPTVREFVNDDGSYSGGDVPEVEDPSHEESKGEEDADDTKVRKMPMDTSEEVEAREAEIQEATTKKSTKKASKKR